MRMKKVGLVTLYNSDNYGALLQAYALQQSIKEYDCECIVIKHDRFGAVCSDENKAFNLQMIIKILKLICKCPRSINYYLNRVTGKAKTLDRINCSRFRDEYINPKSEIFYESVEEIMKRPPQYDAYVCGSDQIWNPQRIKNSEPFFLDFGTKDIVRIAYAPSLATDVIPYELHNYYKEKIRKIDFLSIREHVGCSAMKEATGISAKCVLDPIFLLEKEKWEQIKIVPSIANDKFIFCYFLDRQNLANMRKKIIKYAKMVDAQVIVLMPENTGIDRNWKTIVDAGPREFLGLILKAECVFTDSFHGTAFSIKLEKNFYTYKNLNKKFSRIQNILDLFGLEECAVNEKDYLLIKDINYNHIKKKVELEVEKSKRFLEEALSMVSESK